MIIDCHTQIWDSTARFGRAGQPYVAQAAGIDSERYLRAIDPVDRAIVLAFKSRYLDAEIPNRSVAEYVSRNSPKLIGFAGIDPTERDAVEEMRVAQEELGLKGITVSPSLQNFHPSDTRAMRIYEECCRRGMPIVFNQNQLDPAARMEFGRPFLIDEVAREFPELRMVIAHLGYPWIQETIVLLGKHKHVYADVAGLLRQPWQAYNALLSAHECGVMGKLLFGSNFPFRSPAACIETLYSVNRLSAGSNLPTIPREQLRGIVERDALRLLGIEVPAQTLDRPKRGIFDEED
jgi:predicted TIM-barrel fold metal-dependent hydrolase